MKAICDFKIWFNQASTKPQQAQHRYVTAGGINLCKSESTQKFTNSPHRVVERELDSFNDYYFFTSAGYRIKMMKREQ